MRCVILIIAMALAISYPVNLISHEFVKVKIEMAEKTAINVGLNAADLGVQGVAQGGAQGEVEFFSQP